MSVTVTPTILDKAAMLGGMNVVLLDLAMSGTYVTNGVPLTASMLGLRSLENVIPLNPNAGGLSFGYEGAATDKYLKICGGTPVVYTIPAARGGANANIATDGTAVGSAPTNYNWISTTAAANNTTAFTIAKQPDAPRNVSITIHATSTGVTTTARTYAVVGTFNGAAQTESIAIPAVALTNGNILTTYGSKPFDSITSITPSGAQPSNTAHMAGIGTKFGLPVALLNAAETDVKLVQNDAAAVAISSITDTTNNTVNVGDVADGKGIVIKYIGKGNAGTELPNGAAVSATVRVIALGL
jgi:hypothetical protein